MPAGGGQQRHPDRQAGPNGHQRFTSCNTNQGISAGWADLYSKSLPCQFIVIDGVPDGTYVLRSTTNAQRIVPESHRYDAGDAPSMYGKEAADLSWERTSTTDPISRAWGDPSPNVFPQAIPAGAWVAVALSPQLTSSQGPLVGRYSPAASS